MDNMEDEVIEYIRELRKNSKKGYFMDRMTESLENKA